MMLEKKTTEFLEDLSSAAPAPGGGGACAAAGAFAAALGMMVANLTIGKKRYAAYEEEIKEALEELRTLRDELVRLTDEDAKAFEPLAKAYRMPKDTQEQAQEKERVMEISLCQATEVPLLIMEKILEVEEALKILGEKGSVLAASDVGVGILFAQASLEGASFNVFINTKMMKDRVRAKEFDDKAEDIIKLGAALKEEIYLAVAKKIK